MLHRNKDGDWYVYPWFVASENLSDASTKVEECSKIIKPGIHTVISTGTNVAEIWLSLFFVADKTEHFCPSRDFALQASAETMCVLSEWSSLVSFDAVFVDILISAL